MYSKLFTALGCCLVVIGLIGIAKGEYACQLKL